MWAFYAYNQSTRNDCELKLVRLDVELSLGQMNPTQTLALFEQMERSLKVHAFAKWLGLYFNQINQAIQPLLIFMKGDDCKGGWRFLLQPLLNSQRRTPH